MRVRMWFIGSILCLLAIGSGAGSPAGAASTGVVRVATLFLNEGPVTHVNVVRVEPAGGGSSSFRVCAFMEYGDGVYADGCGAISVVASADLTSGSSSGTIATTLTQRPTSFGPRTLIGSSTMTIDVAWVDGATLVPPATCLARVSTQPPIFSDSSVGNDVIVSTLVPYGRVTFTGSATTPEGYSATTFEGSPNPGQCLYTGPAVIS